MSVFSALYTGASGVNAMGKSLQVIGNNIANINTVGFKASRAEFADLLSQAINTPSGKKQVGRGVRVESVQGIFNQGSFESTSVVTDVAINGSGYFVVSTGSNDETFFTRAGQFRIDSEGALTNSLGMYVQGTTFDNAGNPLDGAAGNINLSSVTAPPNPTGDGVMEGTGVFTNINLSAQSEVVEGGWDPDDPNGTSNFTSTMVVYDSVGVPHTVINYYNRISRANDPVDPPDPLDPTAVYETSDWEWHSAVDGGEVLGEVAGDFPIEVGSGVLSFDTNGLLISPAEATIVISFKGGATKNQAIGIDFTGTTQVGTDPSVVNALTQDGYGSGSLQAIDISTEGVITGVFSNGVARDLAQFTIASFPAEHELFRVGNSLFIETPESGQAVLAPANSGTNGTIAASTVELSNVDLTEQFVSLITTQRAFQASTKVISTGDEMLETVLALKR